ncbi:hypothetical protein [Donghicola tyrosinivorans]|uniref:Uncharacterized protein n=1 Tax=Donghicola tyrosinivorans TaxID=1652492 RepID=A0A2T0X5M8_9RHOB|nr:hypothetical protein [Donghicola tyrosinivorans]PRY94233.1 hypothetical protein CLV74_101369 [Donghicola tyrosinivorans]
MTKPTVSDGVLSTAHWLQFGADKHGEPLAGNNFMRRNPVFWSLAFSFFVIAQSSWGETVSPRLSQNTIERIYSAPESASFSHLPDSECEVQQGIKRCIGIYIPEIRSYFPEQTNPTPNLQISYKILEVRVWSSENGRFIVMTMETRGAIDLVATVQADMHRDYFESVLPSDQLDRLASENWSGDDFFANVDLQTNIVESDILDRLSEITGADLQTTLGHGRTLIFGYPDHHATISYDEILLLSGES